MKKIFKLKSKRQQKWSLEEEFLPAAYDIEEYRPPVEASPEAMVLMESWLNENSTTSSTNSILKHTNAYDITAELLHTAQKSQQGKRNVSFVENNQSGMQLMPINDSDLLSVNSGDDQWSPSAEKFKSSILQPEVSVKASFEYVEKIEDLAHLIRSPTMEFQELPSPLSSENQIPSPIVESHPVPSPVSLFTTDVDHSIAQIDNDPVDWLDHDTSSDGLTSHSISSQGKSTVITSLSEGDCQTYLVAMDDTKFLLPTYNQSFSNGNFISSSNLKTDKPLPPMPKSPLPTPPSIPSVDNQKNNFIGASNFPEDQAKYPTFNYQDSSSITENNNIYPEESVSKRNSGINFPEVNNILPPPIMVQQVSMGSDLSTATSIKLDITTASVTSPVAQIPSRDESLQGWRKSSIQSSIFEVGILAKQDNESNSDSIDYGSDDDELPLSIVSSRLQSDNSASQLTPKDSKPRLEFHKVESLEGEDNSPSLITPVEMPPNIPIEVVPFSDNRSKSPTHSIPEQVLSVRTSSPIPRLHSSPKPLSSLRLETTLDSPEDPPKTEVNLGTTSLSEEIFKCVSPEAQELPPTTESIPRPTSATGGVIPKTLKTHSLKALVAERQIRSSSSAEVVSVEKDVVPSPRSLRSIDSYSLRDLDSPRPSLIGSRPYSMPSSMSSRSARSPGSRIFGDEAGEGGRAEQSDEQDNSMVTEFGGKLPDMDDISSIAQPTTLPQTEKDGEGIPADEVTHRSLDYSVESENLLSSVKEYQPFAPESVARVKELQKTENGYQKIRNSHLSNGSQLPVNADEIMSDNYSNRPLSSGNFNQPESTTPPFVPPGHPLPPQPQTMPGYDPRLMPGYDPRLGPVYDPRLMPGYDPRLAYGYDPRLSPNFDPRLMSSFDPSQNAGYPTTQNFPIDSNYYQPNVAQPSMASYYYGDPRVSGQVPHRQPSSTPSQFQNTRPLSQGSLNSFSSSLPGYPIQPPILLKKTVPLAIPARKSSLYLSPTLKRLSMSLNKENR